MGGGRGRYVGCSGNQEEAACKRAWGGGEGGGGMPGGVRRLPVCAAVAVGGWAQKCTRAFEVTP